MADVVIVGGGPAGLTAAIAAAGEGARALVLEQLDRPAAKLAAAGGGRCNLTNTLDRNTFMARFGRQGRFMAPALEAMDSAGLRQFLDDLGVATHAPDGLRVYPKSNSGADVQRALWGRVKELLGATLRLGARVTGILLEGHAVCGLVTDAGRYAASRIVLATGGKAYPSLGASGSGYALAAQAGHAIVDPRPALVPLVVQEVWPRACAGISVPGARVWIDRPGQARAGVTGDILFTHRGVSGPGVLDLSGDVSELLARGPSVPIRVCLTPGVSTEEWLGGFTEWESSSPRKTVHNLLDGALPQSLARAVAEEAGIGREARISEVSSDRRRRLAERLTAARLTVVATEGFAQAMATRGGVGLDQVDPVTLESRLVKGLHFAGEVLDLDGPCGGFNLQWAFSSGFVAGRSAGAAA